MLHLNAHDMLYSHALEVLLATRFKELVASCEPVEDLFITVPCADEQWIFTKVVLLLQSLKFIFLEDL